MNRTPKIYPHSPYLPYRQVGRPQLKWDDHIRRFCIFKRPDLNDFHWDEILIHRYFADLEEEYIICISHTAELI